ncbi:MAG: DNA adenine methylase [Parcubacteria group bacterium Gr01-1014_20]|nr:MAG: DNA adenine methylase [Parcubacteria group bacterium Gr01-1014_20]
MTMTTSKRNINTALASSSRRAVKPFLKWVGGKTQLLSQLRKFYPSNFNRYFEPFLGGGAVFFDVKPRKAFLNDINSTLITAYKHVQKETDELVKHLHRLQNKYRAKSEEGRDEFYYEMRDRYNDLRDGSLDKTAHLIFLNKTGFNGLYRESSNGGFNVPFGRYKNPLILDEENLLTVAEALTGVTLTALSFEKAVADSRRGDFVYFDPPYYPLNGTAKFTNYHEKNFLEDEQVKLRDVFIELDKRGCYVMMSNSHTDFISKLYSRFNKHAVLANRAINCKAEGRGKIKEYVITNYKI